MTAMMHVGDLVTIPGYESSYPGVWKIIKVNPTRYRLEPVGGGGALACPHSMVAAHNGDAPVVATSSVRERFWAGQVVTVINKAGLFVVLVDKGKRVNVAVLGGEQGRYWRVPPSSLAGVSLADLPTLITDLMPS